MSFLINISTPQGSILRSQIDAVTLETESGAIQLLANHIPILTQLNIALIKVETAGKSQLIFVNGGVAEVTESGTVNVNTTFGILLGSDKDSIKNYLTTLEATKNKINDLQAKALAAGQYFEQSQTFNNYLFEEERLAKFEMYQEMMRGK